MRKLETVIGKLGCFLIRSSSCAQKSAEDGALLTPNGNHRLAAMRTLGASVPLRSSCPRPRRIDLALNTEKAHNLRENPWK